MKLEARGTKDCDFLKVPCPEDLKCPGLCWNGLLPPHHHISKILLNLWTASGNITHTEQQGMSCCYWRFFMRLAARKLTWPCLHLVTLSQLHQPQESCKETNNEPYESRTHTAQGHTPQTGVIPGPPKLYQKVNIQWPPRRLRKNVIQANNYS